MKKILFSVLLTAALSPLATAAAPRVIEDYAAAQSAVPEGGYVVALYADGWDKYSKKLAQKLLKESGMQTALADCAVMEYAVPNFSTADTNKARGEKYGKLPWVAPSTYPAFVMYDKNGRHYATIIVPYADRKDTDKIVGQVAKAREAVKKQEELLEKAKGEEGLAKAQTLGKAAAFDNINRPGDIVKQLKAVDPQDKAGHIRRLELSVGNYAEACAKTQDWRATLKEVEDKIADKSYTDSQRQGLYAIAIGLIRRHGDLKTQKKLPRYLSEMEKIDPKSPLGRSADHAKTIWVSELSYAAGWAPSVLPTDGEAVEIKGPLPIKAAGTYEVTFTYSRGSDKLVITGLELYDGSRKVAEDKHRGETGHKHIKNVYTLKVDSKLKSPKLMITVDMPKNRDSYGIISIKKK